MLSFAGYVFQSVAAVNNIIAPGTSLLAIERVAPATTVLTLPNLLAQWRTGRALSIADWSSAVTEHNIVLTPPDSATIMRSASWQLFSTTDQLSGVTLQPSPELNGWIIAP